MKLSVYNILHFSFYLNVLLGVIMNIMNKSEYSFPPNMGWIIMIGFLTIIHKDNN